MKKILFSLLSIFTVFIMAACDKDDLKDAITTETTIAEEVYKDGTYTATGENWGYGIESVDVIIENGKIANVTLRRLQTDGTEVDYDEWTGADDKPNLKQMRADMASQIISEQSVDNVDSKTGATTTTQNWIDLVKEALDKAKQGS